ncbi:MAG: RtcB family protein, partial [Gammaproteobacteria bacterium]|nr:RtcB family protein [Gammaproteobacteria bacterium]
MDLELLKRKSEFTWQVEPFGKMQVPGVIYGDEKLIKDMDHKVYEQVTNVATLPGIVEASYAMPDAHWGYGFPIGGVAAFDSNSNGVISAGGVGFDISCGVRTLHTRLIHEDIEQVKNKLADKLYKSIPAGVGSTGRIKLDESGMDAMLTKGAQWAIQQGFGENEDLERIEEQGCMSGAKPNEVSQHAKKRQREEMGTLGSGNHYLEIQYVAEIFDPDIAKVFGLKLDEVVISIHCGSRGLGHQIGTEFLKKMAITASDFGISLPDRELACSPIKSSLGQAYLGAMRAAINCALANREIITHLTREVFAELFPQAKLSLLYDVSHNTCKVENHSIDGKQKELFVHRKGATRAFGPGHDELPEAFRNTGQPVLIGGSMGTESYVLVGTQQAESLSFSSSCHGAGRSMSRHQAKRTWK